MSLFSFYCDQRSVKDDSKKKGGVYFGSAFEGAGLLARCTWYLKHKLAPVASAARQPRGICAGVHLAFLVHSVQDLIPWINGINHDNLSS